MLCTPSLAQICVSPPTRSVLGRPQAALPAILDQQRYAIGAFIL